MIGEEHGQWLRDRISTRLKRDFKVSYDDITCQGEREETARFATLCGFCLDRQIRAPLYFEENDGPDPMGFYVDFAVDLNPLFRMWDNTGIPIVWLILAGQCSDCGHVYYIYSMQKKGNPYIGTRDRT